jgi:hypothetical protein
VDAAQVVIVETGEYLDVFLGFLVADPRDDDLAPDVVESLRGNAAENPRLPSVLISSMSFS